jgi:hypothetical protein
MRMYLAVRARLYLDYIATLGRIGSDSQRSSKRKALHHVTLRTLAANEKRYTT